MRVMVVQVGRRERREVPDSSRAWSLCDSYHEVQHRGRIIPGDTLLYEGEEYIILPQCAYHYDYHRGMEEGS